VPRRSCPGASSPGEATPPAARGGARLRALVLALLAAGCATTPAPVAPPAIPAAQAGADLARRWEAEWREFQGLRAAVDLVVVRRGESQRTAGVLLLSPTHLRFEAISPIGFATLVVVAGPDQVVVFNPGERRAWVAGSTGEGVGRWLGIPLPPATLIRLLAGFVPMPPDGAPARLVPDGDAVLLLGPGGMTRRVRVGPDGRPSQLEQDDGQRLVARFDRTVDGRLQSLSLEVPRQSLEVHLRYISGESLAPPPGAFELALPPTVRPERVD
jgi:hypothetical protein